MSQALCWALYVHLHPLNNLIRTLSLNLDCSNFRPTLEVPFTISFKSLEKRRNYVRPSYSSCDLCICVSLSMCTTEGMRIERKKEMNLKAGPNINHTETVLSSTLGQGLTCSRGRGMHRRQSCSEEGWGRSWRHFPPVQASLWGNTDVGDTPGLHFGHNTHLIQTPGQDWTNPVWGIKERLSFKYRFFFFCQGTARTGGEWRRG